MYIYIYEEYRHEGYIYIPVLEYTWIYIIYNIYTHIYIYITHEGYVYTCIRLYIYTYIYIAHEGYVYTCIRIHIYREQHERYVYTCKKIYIHTYIYIHIYTAHEGYVADEAWDIFQYPKLGQSSLEKRPFRLIYEAATTCGMCCMCRVMCRGGMCYVMWSVML